MTTARELLTRSMRKAGILARRASPTAAEAADGLKEINSMLGLWSNDNMLIYVRALESFTLTGGDGQYTIGPGADFNTTRPMFIVSAYVRDGSTDHDVTVIPDDAFAQIVDKDTGGIPKWLNYNNDNPTGIIKLSPKPVSNYTLFMLCEKALTSIASLDTVLNFPPGWEDAIMYNIAVRLAPEYGQEVNAFTLKQAETGREMIARTIRRNVSMDHDTPTRPVRNAVSGYW